jgi:hypothetical protein
LPVSSNFRWIGRFLPDGIKPMENKLLNRLIA